MDIEQKSEVLLPPASLDYDNGDELDATKVSASWLELLYDLIFVAVIHNIAEMLVPDEITFELLVKFSLRIFTTWWLWHITVMNFNMKSGEITEGLEDTLPVFGIMICVGLMSSAAAKDDDGHFIILFLIACVICMISQIVTWTTLRNRSLQSENVTPALLDRVAQWSTLAKGMGFVLIVTFIVLVPAALVNDATIRLSLWSGFILFIILGRTLGGYLGRNMSTKFVSKDHLEERYGLLLLILLGEVVGAAAKAKDSGSGTKMISTYGCVVGPIISAMLCGKLSFSMNPIGYEPPTHIDSFRNMIAVHCFPIMACSLAALSAGYSRVVELLTTEDESSEDDDTSIILIVVSTSVFLIFSAPRVGLGQDSRDVIPRFSCVVRALIRAFTGFFLILMVFTIGDRVTPTNWCLLTPSVMMVGTGLEIWGKGSAADSAIN